MFYDKRPLWGFDDDACVVRQVDGSQLVLDQLYCADPGQGHMTRILQRYLRRLPERITEVWTQGHPYRCEDGMHWKDVIRYVRWLRRLGFQLQDRREFFRRLRELAEEWEGYIRFGNIQEECWMFLER